MQRKAMFVLYFYHN